MPKLVRVAETILRDIIVNTEDDGEARFAIADLYAGRDSSLEHGEQKGFSFEFRDIADEPEVMLAVLCPSCADGAVLLTVNTEFSIRCVNCKGTGMMLIEREAEKKIDEVPEVPAEEDTVDKALNNLFPTK